MADINGKWLKDNSVKETSVEFTSGGWLEDADGNIIRREQNGGGGNERIIFGAAPKSATAPTDNADLANKSYVDSVVFGLKDLKDPVRLATAAALPAFTAADGPGTNGAPLSVGKTLTGNANGPLSVDGITVVAGDRILVKDDGADNGIYTVTQVGVVGVSPFILTRATDADNNPLTAGAEVSHGMSCVVESGNTLAQAIFALTTKDPITLDTTPLTFVETPNPADHFDPTRFEKTIPGTATIDGTVAYEIPENLNTNFKADSIQVRVLGGPILSKVQNEYTINGAAPFRITIAASLMDVGKIEVGDVIEVMYGSKA